MVCRGHCFGNGLIMRAVGDRMIIAPPLVITRAQIDEMVALIRRCLDLTLADAQRKAGCAGITVLIDSPDGPRKLVPRLPISSHCVHPTAPWRLPNEPQVPRCSPSAWPWPFPPRWRRTKKRS
jgi:hypothetical protein